MRICALLATLLLAACGDPDATSPEPSPEPSETVGCGGHILPRQVEGAERTEGEFTVELVTTAPERPQRGDNTWLLHVTGADEVTVVATPRMPQHDHGTVPDRFVATPMGDGMYEIGPFDLFMPGYWEINLAIQGDSEVSTMIAVCIEP